MGSVVIGIQRDTSGALAARLSEASVAYPRGQDPSALEFTFPMPDCDTDPNVREYGSKVFNALSAHAGIAAEIRRLSLGIGATMDGLKFLIETPQGEDVRWETLFTEENKFLALEPGCRITRLASSIARSDVGSRTYVFPLRLLAVLSAIKVDATSELKAMCTQIDAARAGGLEIEATVYLGEEELLESKRAESLTGYEFLPMPKSADALRAEIKTRPAQFVHLFGHGIVRSGVPSLEFATIRDHLLAEPAGSVVLAVDGLVNALETQKTSWLTVLNSCSGAASQASLQLNSMAFKVAERGSPYVVGMNEAIDAGDATVLTSIFYREVFDIVAKALIGGSTGEDELDFSPAIVPVRQHFFQVYEKTPEKAFGRWSVPVLYQSLSPLLATRLTTPGTGIQASPDAKARIDVLAGLLRALPESTTNEQREEFLNVLALHPAVPKAFWPDRSGNFPTDADGGEG